MCGYRAYDWNTMAMPRSDGDRAVTVWPSMAISPPETSSRPAMVRSSVDFPQPDGPTNTTNSPSAISRSIPLRTSVDPKFLVTPVSRTSAMFPARRFLLWRHRKRLQPPRNPHEAEASRGPTGTIVPHIDPECLGRNGAGGLPNSARRLGLVGRLAGGFSRRLAARVLGRPGTVAALGLALPGLVAGRGRSRLGVGARRPGRLAFGRGLGDPGLLARRRRIVRRPLDPGLLALGGWSRVVAFHPGLLLALGTVLAGFPGRLVAVLALDPGLLALGRSGGVVAFRPGLLGAFGTVLARFPGGLVAALLACLPRLLLGTVAGRAVA